MVVCPNSTGMVPGWSPTKIVQMVLIGCICRSQGQKIDFQNAIFKNLLVWNYKAQSFHSWNIITSSRSVLPIFGYINVMASPWPLTISSGERPRAIWALLFLTSVCYYLVCNEKWHHRPGNNTPFVHYRWPFFAKNFKKNAASLILSLCTMSRNARFT